MTEVVWMEVFSDNLKDAMEDAGFNLRMLADESGLSISTISKYINKQQMPGVKALVNIAYALGIEVEDLVPHADVIR